MSFIAAILILNLEEDEAFVLFSNLVNRPPLSSFFNMDQQMVRGQVRGAIYIICILELDCAETIWTIAITDL